MSYEEHAEAAAQALYKLLTRDQWPQTADDAETVLQYRECILDSLREQLTHVGADGGFVATGSVRVRDVSSNSVNLLHQFVTQSMRMPGMDRIAPSELLTAPPHANPDVDLWREAASRLHNSCVDLGGARLQPWRTDPGGAWYLVGDIATSVEALTVLDDRATAAGILERDPRPQSARLAVNERRMIISHVASLASWRATSMSPDLAEASDQGAPTGDPLFTVNEPADLAPAQRNLAWLMRYDRSDRPGHTGMPVMDVSTARAVAVGQGRLTSQFAVAAALNADTGPLKDEFRRRQLLLADIQSRLAPLTDVAPIVNRRAMFQQQEISQGMRRFADHSYSPAQLLDLAQATHQVTTGFAKALRYEMNRPSSNLRLATSDGPKKVDRKRHPLAQATTSLARLPAPDQPVARWSGPRMRATLRGSLDRTPTGNRGVPYPSTNAGWTP